MNALWVVAIVILTNVFLLGLIILHKMHVQSNIRSLGKIVKRCNETLDNVLYESRVLRETTKNTIEESSIKSSCENFQELKKQD